MGPSREEDWSLQLPCRRLLLSWFFFHSWSKGVKQHLETWFGSLGRKACFLCERTELSKDTTVQQKGQMLRVQQQAVI